MRNRNGNRRRNGMATATVYRPGTAYGTAFTDTVEILASGTGTGFFLSVAELLPSLQSGYSRNFVFEKFRVEVLPSNDANAPSRVAQVRYRSQVMNEFVALAPYKVLSRVNPTDLSYDVNRLARMVPTAKEIHSTTDSTLVFNLGFANENRESTVSRITTVIRVFPQTSTSASISALTVVDRGVGKIAEPEAEPQEQDPLCPNGPRSANPRAD